MNYEYENNFQNNDYSNDYSNNTITSLEAQIMIPILMLFSFSMPIIYCSKICECNKYFKNEKLKKKINRKIT